MHLIAVVDPDGEERRDEKALDRLERAAHLSRHLSITEDQAGGAWIKGRCSAEDAAMLKATLIPLAAPQPTDPSATRTCVDPAAPTAATPATTAPGCSTPSSRPADCCRPPTSCPSATAPSPG